MTYGCALKGLKKEGKKSVVADISIVMILVSVIMPAYKVEQYLEQCLQSVVNQDLKNIEIIAIDNGSPDRCGEIIKKFASLDKRITPLFIKKNVGYASAVNAGIKFATGKYIAIVDTDDYVEPDMLSSLYSAAEKYGAKIAKGGFTKHFPDGSDLYCRPSCPFYKQEVIVEPLCYNDILYMECSIWSAIYDREFLLKNKIKMPEFPGSESQDVVFKFMTYAAVDFLVCIDKSVYNYRVFSANSASKSTLNWDRHFKNYDVIKQWLIDRNFYKSYKHAYYMCMVTDFVFHYRRLSGNLQNLFCEKARDVCREALAEGVDIFHPRFFDKELEHYYWADVIPLLEKITHNEKGQRRVLQSKNNIKQNLKDLIKNTLKKINKIKIFNRMFNFVISILRKPFFFSKIVANRPMPAPTPLLYNINTNSYHIELDYSTNSKKILVILPWYSNENAVNRNIDIFADMFKKMGYETHLLVYGHSFTSNMSDQATWDRVFWKEAENWYFGLSDATKSAVDGNRVDDWIAGDFLEAVIRLNNHYSYNICMANYLFFTSAFKVLPDTVRKILYTHDKFANRNSALQKAGFQDQSFWFSVATEREEACALKRADIILAIQEEEGEYFRQITKNQRKVMVVPFVPDADFIEYTGLQGKDKIEVGYIASANPPNIAAIENIIKMIKKGGKIRLHIAGSVTYALNDSAFTENILNEGLVDSLRDFYAKCDVIINPDMFYSGLKVKTAEAMSFGAAIVCTKVASTGLPLDKKYHQLESEIECVSFLTELAEMDYSSRLAHITEMRIDSREKYTMYKRKYPLRNLITEMCC